jgi:hypothetical protein
VEVELLGVARLLARRRTVSLPAAGMPTLAELVRALARELPALVGAVIAEDGAALEGHVIAREGRDLLRDPEEPIYPGDRLLLISLEAGG